MELNTLGVFLDYSDWANGQLLATARRLDDAQLDKPFEIGRGSLRSGLLHIYAGEYVWLRRWRGEVETPWINEDEQVPIGELAKRWEKSSAERDEFIRGLSAEDLSKTLEYRDSKGSLFTATLGQMMMQMCVHSTHHRAQVVNMLRRLDAGIVDLDYMYWVRKPAT